MGRNAEPKSVDRLMERRMFLIWFATRNRVPKDRTAVVGRAIAGIAIAGRNEMKEGE